MAARILMMQGATSSAGKSLLVAGLCRSYARRGLRVAPYKSQNMSNNAAVCPDGAEIGRAQYTQALACGIKPRASMNPILIKPEADDHSQVVVLGQPYASLPAREYYRRKEYLWGVATQALDELRAEFDLVIIEGAGSPVELNLRAGDIVNMAIALYAQAPVLLVGDIDRGGIFAQLLGTLWLLAPEERALVQGLVVNKFRGDLALFSDGVQILEARGGVPVLGVVPYVHHRLPEEDAVAIEAQNAQPEPAGEIDIAVVRLPRIANFDDFDPLRAEPGVRLRYIDTPDELGSPDAVILPGTKSTLADLGWLEEQGLKGAIQAYAQQGGAVVGICGGYQMLGRVIRDPQRVESAAGELEGLGLLPAETIFETVKATHQVQAHVRNMRAWCAGLEDTPLSGYEIHMGTTHLPVETTWLEITQRSGQAVSVADGGISADGRVWGCYLHGLLANTELRWAWLGSLGWQAQAAQADFSVEREFDRFADVLERSLDFSQLDRIVGL